MAETLLDEVVSPKEPSSEPPAAIPLRRPEERGNMRKGLPDLGGGANNDTGRPGKPGETGFMAIGEELERRSRAWGNMVRLLEQYRQQLEAAEADRDATHADFSRIVPAVLEAARELKDAMDSTKAGQGTNDIAALFAKNAEALDQLEKVASVLSVRLLWCRTAWEQYAGAITEAQRLRSDTLSATGA